MPCCGLSLSPKITSIDALLLPVSYRHQTSQLRHPHLPLARLHRPQVQTNCLRPSVHARHVALLARNLLGCGHCLRTWCRGLGRTLDPRLQPETSSSSLVKSVERELPSLHVATSSRVCFACPDARRAKTILVYRFPIQTPDGLESIPSCPYQWPNGQGDDGKFLSGIENSARWQAKHGSVYRIWSGMKPEM